MVSLRDLRRRIHSVNNIRQITKAMEMVAGARLHKAEIKNASSRLYMSKLKNMLDKLILSEEDISHPLLEEKTGKKIGLVVVGGDRGLCGSYHTQLFTKADRFLNSFENPQADLILLGSKAAGYYRRKPWNITHSLEDWGGKIPFTEVKNLADRLAHMYLSGNYSAIWVIYTHFKTVFYREIVIEKLLPIEITTPDIPSADYIIEPNRDDVLSGLLGRWNAAKLQNILDEAYASELAARVISMKTASKNAEEMIENLTLVRNRVRQENITREISEIISGAENR